MKKLGNKKEEADIQASRPTQVMKNKQTNKQKLYVKPIMKGMALTPL